MSRSDQFYKIKLCPFLATGCCSKGEDCRYAHSPGDLAVPISLRKTKLCDDWKKGHCTETDCKFAHGEHELKSTPEFFKTSLCKFWTRGSCTAGVSCRHAHGEDDLRYKITGRKESGRTKRRKASDMRKSAPWKRGVDSRGLVSMLEVNHPVQPVIPFLGSVFNDNVCPPGSSVGPLFQQRVQPPSALGSQMVDPQGAADVLEVLLRMLEISQTSTLNAECTLPQGKKQLSHSAANFAGIIGDMNRDGDERLNHNFSFQPLVSLPDYPEAPGPHRNLQSLSTRFSPTNRSNPEKNPGSEAGTFGSDNSSSTTQRGYCSEQSTATGESNVLPNGTLYVPNQQLRPRVYRPAIGSRVPDLKSHRGLDSFANLGDNLKSCTPGFTTIQEERGAVNTTDGCGLRDFLEVYQKPNRPLGRIDTAVASPPDIWSVDSASLWSAEETPAALARNILRLLE